jgi:hypothetical protein
MWACDQAGREVPNAFWKEAETAWRSHQAEDGGWSYVYKATGDHGIPKMSMTMAGVATLFITQDYVHLNDGINCKGNVFDEALVKGTKWIYDKFDKGQLGGGYNLYAMERVGMASGFKYFGEHDWYGIGADALVKRQNKEGSWGSVPETAFAVIFLSRGRSPVIVNKFEYELEGPAPKVAAKFVPPKAGPKSIDGTPAPAADGTPETPKAPTFDGNWCQRPRDVAQFTRWMSKVTERRLNWQIINNRVPVDDFHDAPVLYMSGNQVLTLPKETQEKLRQYIQEGGLVFGHADCGSKEFTDSFMKLGTTLFPSYEFRELPADHPIYTRQQFLRKNWKNPPKVMGLSNGSRELMVILPQNDIAKNWQTEAYQGKEETFQVMNGILLYAVDRQNMKYRGATHIVRAKEAGATPEGGRVLKVARLQFGGNWDPEPAGWTRLAAILKNQKLGDLKVEAVTLGEGKLDVEKHPVAHLTGTGEFTLSKEQLNDLKKYVIKGGVIVCDAAGGNSDFASSAERELAQIIGGSKFELIGAEDPALKEVKATAGVVDEPMMAPGEIRQGPVDAATTQATTQAIGGPTSMPATAPSIMDATAAATTQPKAKVVLAGDFPVEYRKFARTRIGSNDSLRLKGIRFKGKLAVVLSREDLSTGMVGQQVDGVNGYTPACATEIVRRLVLNLSPVVVAKAVEAPAQ